MKYNKPNDKFVKKVYNRIDKSLPLYEKIYFFIIVIYAGMATPFTWGMSMYMDPFGVLLPILLTIILLTRNKVNFNNKNLLITLAIVLFWIILSSIKYFQIKPSNIFLFENIIIAYIMINIYKDKFWVLYVDIVYILSIIGLLGWILVLIMPDIVRHLMIFKTSGGIIEGNNFLFSMTDQNYSLNAMRNSGFSWEPGRYASMVVMAIFINMIRNKCKLIDKKNIILIIALISTFSTTGYATFIFICLILYIYNLKNKKTAFFVLPLMVVVSIYIFSFDFMGEKLSELSKNNADRIDASVSNTDIDGFYTLQRFDGMLWEYTNFIHDPLLGYGNLDISNSYNYKNTSKNTIAAGGVISIFSKFGVFMGLLVYFTIYKTSSMLTRKFNYKGKIFFFLLFILISISYSFFTVPIFMPIWMWSLFDKKNRYNFNIRNKVELINKNI